MSAHTPGPWTWSRAYRLDKDYGRIPQIVPVNGENPVCEVSVDYVEEMMLANARLIAAAPELLAACKKALDAFWGTVEQPAQEYANDALRAAIAKAEGRA